MVCAMAVKATAQSVLPDPTMKDDFDNYVKSVDEFIHRFNGDELHPGITKSDGDYLRKNMFWLFNFDVDKDSKTKLLPKMEKFIETAISSGVKLSFNDSTWFAKASFMAAYKGKEVELTMILRTESTPKAHNCWKICGIQGMEKLGLYTKNKPFSISNIEHEVNFVELKSIFKNNKENVFGYMSKRNHIDQLSVFMTLVRTGQLSYGYVSELCFIFTSVPDYVFTIREFGRRGNNAGWLISSFEQCKDKQKYINNLTNK